MASLTEAEIFDRLKTSLRSAIELCGLLATEPAQGPNYLKICDELQTIENCSRQAGVWREDMRWHKFGYEMMRFHQRIGDAIRSHMARDIFLHMQGMMQGALLHATKMQTAKTGRRGMILPKQRPVHRENRPVAVSKGGIILPSAL